MICPGGPNPQEKRAQTEGTRRTHDAMGPSPRLKTRSPPHHLVRVYPRWVHHNPNWIQNGIVTSDNAEVIKTIRIAAPGSPP
jgi:hypothetical protein